MDGRLRAGASLPATRILAGDLGVSRGLVVEAYQRLADEGLVSARPGTGTRVLGVSRPAVGSGEASGVPVVSGHSGVSEYSGVSGSSGVSGASRASGVSGASRAAGSSGVSGVGSAGPLLVPLGWRERAEIDLSPGVPDLSGFPRAAWLRAERLVLERASVADLGYGDPRGTAALRTELAGWLARTRGLRAGPGDIIVVTGVAQALALLARVLRGHGHGEVAVEDPGSRGARDDLAYWGLRPVPVPVDEHGLDVSELARGNARAALLTPAHQFPTGVVLAPGRRRDLLDWAAGAEAVIIEDDYDAEYRYDRAPVPALHASAPGLVAYAGSTSKTLAPGMRLGWLIPPPWLHAELVEAKYASDLGSPALPQLVLARLIASGELEQHIRLVRKRQRSRRDALLLALREHLPAARVQGIAAGLHLLITFPWLDGAGGGGGGADGQGGLDADLAEAILRTGVLVHPLSWHRQRRGTPGIVLGYAAHTPGRLQEAVRRIARALA
jgi:GntR family transcriptional regulator/MocR family aminotransferase